MRGALLPLVLIALALPATAPDAHAAKPPRATQPQGPATALPGTNPAKRTPDSAGDAATRGRPRVAPRILDDIRIEGEIPVPQVLFITARDQRRFMEFQHHRYQVSSTELGRATPAPRQLVIPTPRPDPQRQEEKR